MRRRIQVQWERTPPAVRKPASVATRTLALYNEDSCGTYAAAIAYYAIFSVVPLALIVLSILGLVVGRDSIVDFVFEQVPLERSPGVQQNVDQIVERAQRLSLASLGLGVLALLWSASGIFAAVRRGLNAAAHRRASRPYWRGKLVDFALIPIFGALILASLLLTASVQSVVDRLSELGPFRPHQNIALRLTGYALPALASYAMFALLYRYIPSSRPRWPEALRGGLFAAILFEGAKNAYAYLLANTPFSSGTAIYAGFGTALSFLFWMFINASILLLGAEFIRALKDDGATIATGPEVELAPLAGAQLNPRPLHRSRR